MGCDIHIAVEKRKDKDSPWQLVSEPVFPCADCKGTGRLPEICNKSYYEPERKCYWCEGEGTTSNIYNGRNYNLFGILAGVRDYDWPQIAEQRGLPDDISSELVAKSNDYGTNDDDRIWLGDHSFSWLTVKEILAYEWDRPGYIDSGWVTASEFKEWQANGRPRAWAGGVGGGGVRHVDKEEMARAIEAGEPADHLYCQVEWPLTARDAASNFLERLKLLAPLGEPENVRLVFGFDS